MSQTETPRVIQLTRLDELAERGYVLVDLVTGTVLGVERLVAVRACATPEDAFDDDDSAISYAQQFGKPLYLLEDEG